MFVIVVVFPNLSTLERKNKEFGPQIRILREISSLEPAPKVWKPMSRSKNSDVLICVEHFCPSSSRFPEGCKFRNPVRI